MKSEIVHCRELEQYLSGEHKVVRWKLFPTNIMTKELPAGIRGSKRILTRFGTLILSIRDSSPNLWPMSLVGILSMRLAADPIGVVVIVPTNSTVRVIATNVVGVGVVVPTNVTVQVFVKDGHDPIPPWTIKTNLCDIPITSVTSSSISNPSGPNLTVTHNKVFRRAHQNKETK